MTSTCGNCYKEISTEWVNHQAECEHCGLTIYENCAQTRLWLQKAEYLASAILQKETDEYPTDKELSALRWKIFLTWMNRHIVIEDEWLCDTK